MPVTAPTSTLAQWRAVLADGFRWGLGDPDINQPVNVIPHGAKFISPPGVIIWHGGLDNRLTAFDDSPAGTSMCRRRATWTAYLIVGRPYDVGAYDTLDLWVERLDRVAARVAAHPDNPDGGQEPTFGDPGAPLNIPVGDVEMMAAAVEVSVSYQPPTN